MHNNGPRLHRLHSLSSALNETNRHVFHHRNTQVHKPDWRMARAAFQHSGRSFCHTSPKLMSATTTPNNTTVMSPRHLYQETFSRSRWGNKAVQRPGESWPPCGWETTSAEDSAALSVSDVGCWRNLQITTSLSQGQGWWVWRRGTGIALIWSASVLRLSWVRTAPCHPWWYTKTGRLSLISLHADKIHDLLKRCTKKRRSSLLLPPPHPLFPL